MMGEEIDSDEGLPDAAGIIPRFSQNLINVFETSEQYSQTKVEISYFEIYKEKIRDLLCPSQNGRGIALRVREHPEIGPYIIDLTSHKVASFEALQNWLMVGNKQRASAPTEMNLNSSRSHFIFSITLTHSQTEDILSLCSKINLVDLAGSERQAYTCATGKRLREGGCSSRVTCLVEARRNTNQR